MVEESKPEGSFKKYSKLYLKRPEKIFKEAPI